MYTIPLESRYTFSPRKGLGDTLCNKYYVFVTRLGPIDKKVIEVATAFWIPVFRSDDDDGYENDESEQNFFLGYNTLNSLQASDPAAGAMADSFPYHFVRPTPQQGSGGIIFLARWFAAQHIQRQNLIQQYDRFVVTRSDRYYTPVGMICGFWRANACGFHKGKITWAV